MSAWACSWSSTTSTVPAEPDPVLRRGVRDGDRDPRVAPEVRRPAPALEAVDDDRVAVEQEPDDGLARSAVWIGRRDGRVARRLEERPNAGGQGSGRSRHRPIVTRARPKPPGGGRYFAVAGRTRRCGVAPARRREPGGRRRPGHGRGAAPPWGAARRQVRRPADQVALAELHAERAEHREVGPLLDALGQQPRPDPAAERDERLDQGLLRVVAGDALGDHAVDLDDRRMQRGDQREARVARAGIVDREPESEPAQRLDRLQRDHVGDRLLLGAFEGDLARRQAGGDDHQREGLRLELAVEQAGRREVDREPERREPARQARRPRARRPAPGSA